MNTITKSKPATGQDHGPFPKNLPGSVAARVIALAAVGILLAVPDVKAQTKLSTADNDFILATAQDGMTEVELGELAAKMGTRGDVKAFGQKMVTDHSAMNGDLKALALQKGVAVPAGLDAKHQAKVDKMASLTGPEFDAAYISDMIKGHKGVLKAFKAESKATQDAEIKSFLDKSTPVVKEHLKLAAALKSPALP